MQRHTSFPKTHTLCFCRYTIFPNGMKKERYGFDKTYLRPETFHLCSEFIITHFSAVVNNKEQKICAVIAG